MLQLDTLQVYMLYTDTCCLAKGWCKCLCPNTLITGHCGWVCVCCSTFSCWKWLRFHTLHLWRCLIAWILKGINFPGTNLLYSNFSVPCVIQKLHPPLSFYFLRKKVSCRNITRNSILFHAKPIKWTLWKLETTKRTWNYWFSWVMMTYRTYVLSSPIHANINVMKLLLTQKSQSSQTFDTGTADLSKQQQKKRDGIYGSREPDKPHDLIQSSLL